MITLFSFFSGIGFLDLGFQDEGYNVAFVNEIHAPFLDAYKYARKDLFINEPEYGYHLSDINVYFESKNQKILTTYLSDVKSNGDIVGFIGGPPCPDFSVGGKNRGKEGDNGKLSQTYINLISYQKPDFFLFENVKGLWKTKRHRAFYEDLKSQLIKNGYSLTEKMINSIECSVPQDRERIFLFGVHESLLNEFYNNKMLTDFNWSKYTQYGYDKAFGYNWPETEEFKENSKKPKPKGLPSELTVEGWFRKNDVELHPNSIHYFKPKAGLARFLSVKEGDYSKKSFKRLHRWRYSPTACYGNNEVHLHPYKARRISVSEALAIQSLPKEFQLPPNMTLTNMFKGIGNGVPYLTSKVIAHTIKDFMGLINENKIYSVRYNTCDRATA